MSEQKEEGLPAGWWTLIFVVATVGVLVLTATLFSGALHTYATVTLTSGRAGLVMDRGAKVKMRGVQIGRVARVTLNQNQVDIELEIEPDQLRYIPANVGARIRAGTLFSAKFVELVYPSEPAPQRLAAGSIISSDNVSTEINTLFRDVADILNRVDPAKLQATLSALAEGLRGRGAVIGQAITDTNEVLKQVNARTDTLQGDRQAVRRISDAYAAAAPDILTALDAAGTTSGAITDNAAGLDQLLTEVVGLARGGVDLIGSSQADLTRAVELFESTARLLVKYQPTFTCTLVGAKTALDGGYLDATGGANHKSIILDSAVLLGPIKISRYGSWAMAG